jgi:ferredoxin
VKRSGTAVILPSLRSGAMRIEVDAELCTGHGRCYSLAPEVYEADDEGYCATRSLEVPVDLEDAARLGAKNCPERAISVIDG